MGCSKTKVQLDEQSQDNIKKLAEQYKNSTINAASKAEDIKILHNTLVIAKKESIGKYYKILEKIGSGTFGKVYKVMHLTVKCIRAMKVVKRDTIHYQDDDQTFLKEIEVLSILDHPNIIKLYEYYEDDLNYYFITDYAEGGELYEKIYEIKNYNEGDSAHIMEQLLSAVSYIHSKGVVHRDIKPENILLETNDKGDMNIKIIDFGTANFYDKNTKLTLKVGTPYYIAPEVLNKNYSNKCDIWSCGVIMYILISGSPPFDGSDDNMIMEKVKKGSFSFKGKEWSSVSEDAKDLISKLLTYDPKKRISGEAAMNHSWISKFSKIRKEKGNQNFQNVFILRKPFEMLKKFNAKQKLQQATIAFLVHHASSNEMLKDLRIIFREMDENGDGTLSYEEIRNGFRKYYKDEDIAEKELETLIKKMDQDDNKCIEYEEFLRATVDLEVLLTNENLKLAFNSFDSDGSGMLSLEEIKKILGVIESNDSTLIKEILEEIDENGDGEISFEEFKDLMKKVLKVN